MVLVSSHNYLNLGILDGITDTHITHDCLNICKINRNGKDLIMSSVQANYYKKEIAVVS